MPPPGAGQPLARVAGSISDQGRPVCRRVSVRAGCQVPRCPPQTMAPAHWLPVPSSHCSRHLNLICPVPAGEGQGFWGKGPLDPGQHSQWWRARIHGGPQLLLGSFRMPPPSARPVRAGAGVSPVGQQWASRPADWSPGSLSRSPGPRHSDQLLLSSLCLVCGHSELQGGSAFISGDRRPLGGPGRCS